MPCTQFSTQCFATLHSSAAHLELPPAISQFVYLVSAQGDVLVYRADSWEHVDTISFLDTTAEPGESYTYTLAAYVDEDLDGSYTAGTDYLSETGTDDGLRGFVMPPVSVSATDGQYTDRVVITSGEASPQPGDWRQISFDTNTTASALNGLDLEYAGRGGTATIDLNGHTALVTIADVTFTANQGADIEP